MENRNTLIAVALMLLLWVGYTIMFPVPPAPAPSAPPATPAPVAAAVVTPTVVPAAVDTVMSPAPVQPPVQVREIVVESDLYRAVISSSGARIKEFQLKKYKTKADSSGVAVDLVSSSLEGGTMALTGEGDLSSTAAAVYVCDETAASLLLSGNNAKSLTFTLPLSSGVILTKTYTFHGDDYAIGLEIAARNPTLAAKQGKLALSLLENTQVTQTGDVVDDTSSAITLIGKKLKTDKLSSLDKGEKSYSSELLWSGYRNKYFLKTIVPLDKAGMEVGIRKSASLVETRFISAPLVLPAGTALSQKYLTYVGPLDYKLLKSAGHDLELAVDLGFFAIIVKPLFYVLTFFYEYVGNYGWAIIILTVLIKLIFWPMTDKSYKSMKAMQKLQPEMQKLKDKYKNDRDRMNLEIMNLYKENRVNPMSGCLPLIIQMPIFFALYQTLMIMIELRHAPFMLWITDLAAKDPYYITPIVMGATMVLQQKLTPSQLDPIQQKMMMIMPVVFTFICLNMPSGLVVYWLVNNVLSIAQQYMIIRRQD